MAAVTKSAPLSSARMAQSLIRPSVRIGILPTHLKFVGGLVPDENGRLQRTGDGDVLITAATRELIKACPIKIELLQFSYFPGLHDGDVEELMTGLRECGIETQFILMMGGGDPMDPADEDAVVEILASGLDAAQRHGVTEVGSTSVEQWMQPGAARRDGDAFKAAVDQNVRVHLRAIEQAGVLASSIKSWNVEFLRGGEFQTFTDLSRIWTFIQSANKAVGRPFFKVLLDAAHCGDSGLSFAQHVELINEIAAADALGSFHASAKTTRGCLSTDDGWIGALLAACSDTGKLTQAYVELFHHEDEALQPLRDLDPGHGVDTTLGRSYQQVVIDGLVDLDHRLRNLAQRPLRS